jgi:serine protease Do
MAPILLIYYLFFPSLSVGLVKFGQRPEANQQAETSEQAFLGKCKAARAAIVTIFAGSEIGTGSVISPDGLVLTNEHVIRTLENGVVRARSWQKAFYQGRVIATDRANDLALVQLQTETPFPQILEPEKPGTIQPGELVCALGSPRAMTGVLAWGTLLGYRGEQDLRSAILLHPGNSGGPLLNAQGKMIGVNKSIWRSQDGRNDGLSFATNATTATVSSLMEQGRRYLASQGSESPTSTMPATPADNGASPPLQADARLGVILDRRTLVVQIVEPESPAEKAGLNAGDRLLAVNGEPLKRLEDLRGFLDRKPDSAWLKIERQHPLPGQQKEAAIAISFIPLGMGSDAR